MGLSECTLKQFPVVTDQGTETAQNDPYGTENKKTIISSVLHVASLSDAPNVPNTYGSRVQLKTVTQDCCANDTGTYTFQQQVSRYIALVNLQLSITRHRDTPGMHVKVWL